MKRFAAILLALTLCLTAGACGKHGVPARNAPMSPQTYKQTATPAPSAAAPGPTQVVRDFFTAFADADYEAMKAECTRACVADEFHVGDVYGMQRASAKNIGAEELSGDRDTCDIQVTVAMTPAAGSPFTGTEATFFVELELENGAWRIEGFDTDR